jgi:AbiU2
MAKLLPFDERLKEGGQLLMLARIFYDVWWFYEGAHTRPKINDTLNAYSEFFRFDMHAHFVSMVVHLASLFENRSDTVNLGALIDEAEKFGVPEAAIAMTRARMSAIGGISRKLTILRSNLFGHRSASLAYQEVFMKAKITADEIKELTVAGLAIANILLEARKLDTQIFHDLSLTDAERLFNDLAETNEI